MEVHKYNMKIVLETSKVVKDYFQHAHPPYQQTKTSLGLTFQTRFSSATTGISG
ncbi:hypothetical protein FD25_GL000295 [Levilactobacillus acidifarinae DSM 19394]|uniref:Uncharacterized protein n=1 Tax=Levilactobacillus acidifarinae DSM 19394 = JCM 15949 TaxID=1423715 RepID=A0A0R1LFT9_9LACO|nr:hypothetical protein FD25_GL000295 [Levilactobacillus acidifarinae DSM 19394]